MRIAEFPELPDPRQFRELLEHVERAQRVLRDSSSVWRTTWPLEHTRDLCEQIDRQNREIQRQFAPLLALAEQQRASSDAMIHAAQQSNRLLADAQIAGRHLAQLRTAIIPIAEQLHLISTSLPAATTFRSVYEAMAALPELRSGLFAQAFSVPAAADAFEAELARFDEELASAPDDARRDQQIWQILRGVLRGLKLPMKRPRTVQERAYVATRLLVILVTLSSVAATWYQQSQRDAEQAQRGTRDDAAREC